MFAFKGCLWTHKESVTLLPDDQTVEKGMDPRCLVARLSPVSIRNDHHVTVATWQKAGAKLVQREDIPDDSWVLGAEALWKQWLPC